MNGNPELYLLIHREVVQEIERRMERQQRLKEAKRARAAQRGAKAQPRFSLRRLLFFL